MATDIIMPKMGESITEGTITQWKKKLGDQVKKDETILEISTDKVDSEVPSPASGTLIEILSGENETVAVGTVIGSIGKEGENPKISASSKPNDSKLKKDNKKIEEPVSEEPIKKQINLDVVKSTSKSSRFYSPLVRSLAKKEGMPVSDLDRISGTGRGGRVNKIDVMNFIKSNSGSGGISPLAIHGHSLENRVEEMDPVRKKISEHMIHSQQTSAHVYSTIDIDMTNLLKVKKTHSEVYKEKHSIKLSVTSLLIDACIKALGEFPLLESLPYRLCFHF